MEDEMTAIEQVQLAELFEFVDSNPDLSEEELLDQIEQKFSRNIIDMFTEAMTGFAPPRSGS